MIPIFLALGGLTLRWQWDPCAGTGFIRVFADPFIGPRGAGPAAAMRA